MVGSGSDHKNFRRFCVLAGGTSILLAVNYIRNIKSILSSAFDASTLDLLEESKVSKLPEFTIATYIKPEFGNEKSVLHRVANMVKFNYAKRLVGIAQCDNRLLRVRALDSLSRLQLYKWQYSILAHMCNAQMAVALARRSDSPQAADRYFLSAPRKFDVVSNHFLVWLVKNYLQLLFVDSERSHICLQKSMSKIFQNAYDVNRMADVTLGSCEDFDKENELLLPLYLETLRHHSSIPKYTREIPHHAGLHVLMEVNKCYPDEPNIAIQLCQILMNLSQHPDLLDEMYNSGWIAVLAQWAHHPDIRISAAALQALSNFDQDAEGKFTSNLYLLHPRVHHEEPFLVDVIFVHGLLGSVFYTWRNGRPSKCLDLADISVEESHSDIPYPLKASSDPDVQEYIEQMEENEKVYWDGLANDYEIVQYEIPESSNGSAEGPYTIDLKELRKQAQPTKCWARDWLPNDCSHLRILGVNYPTSLSVWAHVCPVIPHDITLEERTHELIDEMKHAGVGKRPIVWVCHSMGGLLVKNAIGQAWKSDDPSIRQLAEQSCAIFFYSTPHYGSKTAILNQTTSYLLWPSMDVKELRENSPNLQRMHKTFLDYMQVLPIKVFSFIETKPTVVSALKLNIDVVERSSGDPGVGEVFEVPLNHLGICKPSNRHSFLYQKVLKEIQNIVQEEKRKKKENIEQIEDYYIMQSDK